MLRLRTIYPYGVNQKITEGSNLKKIDGDYPIIARLFTPLPRSSIRHYRAVKPVKTQPERHFDPKVFRRTIDDKFISDRKNSFHDIRILILPLKKRHLKELAVNLLELLEKDIMININYISHDSRYD